MGFHSFLRKFSARANMILRPLSRFFGEKRGDFSLQLMGQQGHECPKMALAYLPALPEGTGGHPEDDPSGDPAEAPAPDTVYEKGFKM
jgi:hypothetical protein